MTHCGAWKDSRYAADAPLSLSKLLQAAVPAVSPHYRPRIITLHLLEKAVKHEHVNGFN
jgi:hypothetical protein